MKWIIVLLLGIMFLSGCAIRNYQVTCWQAHDVNQSRVFTMRMQDYSYGNAYTNARERCMNNFDDTVVKVEETD